MMVVILIASILLAVGVPSYRYVTNSNRLSAEVNALLGDLQFARSEAIKAESTKTSLKATTKSVERPSIQTPTQGQTH